MLILTETERIQEERMAIRIWKFRKKMLSVTEFSMSNEVEF